MTETSFMQTLRTVAFSREEQERASDSAKADERRLPLLAALADAEPMTCTWLCMLCERFATSSHAVLVLIDSLINCPEAHTVTGERRRAVCSPSTRTRRKALSS